MAATGEEPAAVLRRLANGFQVSQAIHVAAVLGLADRLTDGVRSSAELAEATETDRDALYRLLRALAAAGVFTEHDGHRFELTAVGEHLRTDAEPSLRGWASFIGRPYYWQAWAHLIDSVRTGDNAFARVHGMSAWEYRSAHPEETVVFDRAMAGLTRQVSAAVLAAFDFSRFHRVVDVGGGTGAFVTGLLAAYPAVSAVLFDQPHVVAQADRALRDGPRCTVVGGDFFESVPAGADAYVLKSVLHDWPDPAAVEILMACSLAGGPGSTVLVVERQLAGANEGADAKFSDLNMLVVPGGRERTVEEYEVLFDAAGYRFVRMVATTSPMMVLEATAV